MVFERGNLAKKNDGRQTEVKPGQAGLVLGWVTDRPIFLLSIF